MIPVATHGHWHTMCWCLSWSLLPLLCHDQGVGGETGPWPRCALSCLVTSALVTSQHNGQVSLTPCTALLTMQWQCLHVSKHWHVSGLFYRTSFHFFPFPTSSQHAPSPSHVPCGSFFLEWDWTWSNEKPESKFQSTLCASSRPWPFFLY